MLKNKISLYLIMLKIGCIGFGGGNAIVPIMKKELVEDNNYISEEEFEKAVIVANVTPGALPVELAANIGKKVNGNIGMVLSAFCMALPGVLLSLLMFSLFFGGNYYFANDLKVASIGITTFVILLLLNYICNVINKNKGNKKIILVIVLIVLLCCGKNVCKIIGENVTPIISLSSIEIIMFTLFIILFCSEMKTVKYNKFIALSLVLIYIFSDNIEFKYNNYLLTLTKVIMIVLGIISIVKGLKAVKSSKDEKLIKKESIKRLLKEELVWLGVGAICWLPAIIMLQDNINLIIKGFASSLISFGGGDAYLAIAEGMFIESNMIPSEIFYGQLVPAVNAVPGSILCKTLSGIGFYIGWIENNNILKGVILAFSAFGTAIVASGMIITLGEHVKNLVNKTNFFVKLKDWIMVVVSGLLINIIITLVNQNMSIVQDMQINKFWGVLLTLCLLMVSYIIKNKFKWANIINIIVLAMISCLIFIKL